MNCCNKGKHNAKEDRAKWFWICGLAALAFLVAFFVFRISLGNIFFYAVLLACPLMHLLMMKGMDHGGKD